MTPTRNGTHPNYEGRKKPILRSKMIEPGTYRIHAQGLTFEMTKEEKNLWSWVVKDGLGMWDYKVYRDFSKQECMEAIQTYLKLRLALAKKKY